MPGTIMKTDQREEFNADDLNFANSKPVQANADKYIEIHVDTAKIIESWALSLYSFEWLKDGKVKNVKDLKDSDQEKHRAIVTAIENGESIEQPVLGIGIQDNVEIGSGKAVFLTLTSLGVKTLPVHIMQSCEDDFKAYRVDT